MKPVRRSFVPTLTIANASVLLLVGRKLFDAFPVFRDSILEMDAVFTRVVGESIIHDYGLFDPASSSTFKFPSIWPIAQTLPAISMFQIAFFDLLVHLGVKPDIVLGHSAGETAVLYASGAAPKAMVVELAIIRGRVFSPLESARGTMAALSCTPEDAEALIAEHKAVNPRAAVEIACLNAPAAVAISGIETAIDAILARAQEAGIFARKIRTQMPIHSSMMDACRTQYLDAMRDLFKRYPGAHIPTVKTYSTLSGLLFDEPFDAEYFWKNTREQVLFTPVIQTLGAASTFVEIAPHPVLSSYLSTMASGSSIVLSTVFRPNPKSGKPTSEYRDVLQFLGKLTVAGHNCVDFTALNGAQCTEFKRVLPVYPFLKKQFPLYPDTTTEEVFHGPLNRSRLKLNRETHPTFAEHVIRGEPIWPAAGFLEMVSVFGSQLIPKMLTALLQALEFGATTLFDVNVRSMLSLSSEAPLAVNIDLDGSFWSVTSTVPNRPGKKSNVNFSLFYSATIESMKSRATNCMLMASCRSKLRRSAKR
jgi:acyl transferase domain-containing protein